MVESSARIRLRCTLVIVACVLALRPGVPLAAQAPAASTPDIAAFDAGFRAGQEQFDRGEFLIAARTWSTAAKLLPETPDFKDNRVAIHQYLAEAYQKAVANGASEDIIREGLAVFDAYADSFSAAYPGEALPERVARTRDAFRAVVDAAEEARRLKAEKQPRLVETETKVDTGKPGPTPVDRPVQQKPWKGLMIGGGIALGAGVGMLAMFAAGAARGTSFERQFDDPANGCSYEQLSAECAEIDSQGKAANRLSVAGGILGALLLGGGVALIVVGAKRKSAPTTLSPVLSPSMAGLAWQGRF